MIEFFFERRAEILALTIEHLEITLVALAFTLVLGIPVGILMTRYERFSQPILGFVGMIQTIPSLALLGFLIPFLGIGQVPAIIALILYSLLPIVQNTYVGIDEVDPAVVEAATGIGMSPMQRLFKVELPLALPVLFAGIRTATVLNVGVATICALIGAGGLGSLIFRGINLNNSNMILAGAIPAALLALFLDFLLRLMQKDLRFYLARMVQVGIVVLFVYLFTALESKDKQHSFIAGFPSEFMERADGYPEFSKTYDIQFEVKEMDAALMYSAVNEGKVDVISGYSTDGRIKAFNLHTLRDDKMFFPPYHAAFIYRKDIVEKFPEVTRAVSLIEGKMNDEIMTELNYQVDFLKKPVREVALEFLKSRGINTLEKRTGEPDIIIAWKAFTEQYILAEIFAFLVESQTRLTVELKSSLAGTKIALEALKRGDIHVYPDYTGTGLMVHLNIPDQKLVQSLIRQPDKLYEFVSQQSLERFDIVWGKPLGFNNTYALMMNEENYKKYGFETITDLSNYLKNRR